ncbi:MAG: methyltransferase domain-containing protein [Nitrospirota bacterium]|nr:methyltransferase domain-containing protein [Nitrospirota bacterium]
MSDTAHNAEGLPPTGTARRDQVRDYYAAAAEAPREELCCPTAYRPEQLGHIPPEVLSISYGCGSPMLRARPGAGETVVDLGSGGGIDCFVAARMVGEQGRVIGVDMTDVMLARARGAAQTVAENLGYSVVEFREGFLERIPVDDARAHLVTSNCVLNLSADKPAVFREIHRVLRDGGRFVISDIVSESPVPESMQADPRLWGECISGAVTERAFVEMAEAAGLYGITLARERQWREVGGVRFWSTTFQGYRLNPGAECVWRGQTAVYLGPAAALSDDDGHTFRRGEVVEVCSDTAARLSRPPYAGMFALGGVDTGDDVGKVPGDESREASGDGCCPTTPGCC